MRVEDGVGAGLVLGTFTQAVRCTGACNTSFKAGLRWLVPADLGNSRGARGGGAGASRGRWAPGTHGFAEDFQVGAATRLTFRGTFALIVGLAGVQPARAHAGVGVSGDEDDKIAGSVVVAVLPAVGPAAAGDGKLWARFLVVAESRDEGRCAG